MIVEDRTKADIRILVVEDDPDDAYVVKKVLARRSEPLYVEFASNGLEAKERLQKLQNEKPFLPEMIIIDINMPLMNGLELLDWIRSNRAFDDMVLVIYTTSSEEEVLADARRRGANGALSKGWHAHDQGALGQLFVDYWFHGSGWRFPT